MVVKGYVMNQWSDEPVREYECVAESIDRVADLYEDECGQGEWIMYRIVQAEE